MDGVEHVLERVRLLLGKSWADMAEMLEISDGYFLQVKSGDQALRRKREEWIATLRMTIEEADDFRTGLDFNGAKPAIKERIQIIERRAKVHNRVISDLAELIGDLSKSDDVGKASKNKISAVLYRIDLIKLDM